MLKGRKGEREKGRREKVCLCISLSPLLPFSLSPFLPFSLSPFLPFSLLPRRRGFTLLEVVLALGLAVVVLGLVGMGIHVQLAVAAKSRDQVEEAQLARVLLQRVADDLRNAVPFQPPPSSSSSSSSSSGTAGQASPAALPPRAVPARPLPPARRIRAPRRRFPAGFTARPRRSRSRPRGGRKATLASVQAASDPSQPARLSDIRVVSYSLGAPTSVDLSQNSPPSTSGSGLYRHEQDRAEFFYASQNGQTDDSDPATELLAPEVVDFQLTYYGGTAGTTSTGTSSGTATSGTSSSGTATSGTTTGGTTNADSTTNGTTSGNQWDSTQQGMLPAAVRISISLRREAPKSLLGLLDNREAAAGRLLLARLSAQCGGRCRRPGGSASRPAAPVDDGLCEHCPARNRGRRSRRRLCRSQRR